VSLVRREKLVNVGNHQHKNIVSVPVLCRHNMAESAKSADFCQSGRHVADMLVTVPAKPSLPSFTSLPLLPSLLSLLSLSPEYKPSLSLSSSADVFLAWPA